MKFKLVILQLIFFAIIIPNELLSQRTRPDNEFIDFQLATDKTKKKTQQKDIFSDQLKQAELQLASDGPVDPELYHVGPGDLFTISFGFGGEEDGLFNIPVSADGILFIPTLGGLNVRDKTLAETLSIIHERSKQKYDLDKVEITTFLSQPRLINVHVLGQVTTPGTYTGSALDKVISFVQQAEGFTAWAALNRIQIKHKDGTTDTLDLSKFYHEAKISEEIYLKGGDAIFVPPISTSDGTVYVQGNAENHGEHQIIAGETIEEFLYRIRAIDRSTNLNEIFLKRDDTTLRLYFNNSNGTDLNPKTELLQPGDKIYLSFLKEYVYVHGAVRNPGYFPFIAGFRAHDYAGLAGGTEDMGSLKRVEVFNAASGETTKGAQAEVKRGDSVFVPLSYRESLTKFLEVAGQIASILIAARAVGLINPDK